MHAPAHYDEALEERVASWAKAKLQPKRISHVRGVVSSAEALARRYAPDDVIIARIAAWIHDAAKHWSDAELLAYAEAHNLPITEAERLTPMLLHGAVGYALANEIFDFNDERLRTACSYHTTGALDMNTLDKLIFIADLIEPGRNFPGVETLRAEAERSLDAALLLALDHTLIHLIEKGALIDPRPLFLRNLLIESGVRYTR